MTELTDNTYKLEPTTAVKYDAGKPRYSLIPALSLRELARLYTFGAKKYTRTGLSWGDVPQWLLQKITGLSPALSAVKIECFKRGKCVGVAMSAGFDKEIHSTPLINVKTSANGQSDFLTEYERVKSNEGRTPDTGSEIIKQSGNQHSNVTDSQTPPLPICLSSKTENATYVAECLRSESCIWITIMKAGSSVEYYVAAATTDLECLETISRGLHRHCIISSELNVPSVTVTGDYNWAKGFNYTRCLDALLRHVNLWQAGEDLDEENQLHHMAAVAFYAFAIMYFHFTGTGTDDRYKP